MGKLVVHFGKTCYREVANLLWTCYEETSVMDFGLVCAQCLIRSTFMLVQLITEILPLTLTAPLEI